MSDGLAVLNLEFNAGTDPDRKYDEVLREVNALRPHPAGRLAAHRGAEVQRLANVNILQVALVSDDRSVPEAARARAHRLKERLEHGARREATSRRWAYPEQEVARRTGPRAAGRAGHHARAGHRRHPGDERQHPRRAASTSGKRKFNVKTSGDYASVDEVRGHGRARRDGARCRPAARRGARSSWGDAEADAPRAASTAAGRSASPSPRRDGQNIFAGARRGSEKRARRASSASCRPACTLERGFDQAHNVDHRLRRLRPRLRASPSRLVLRDAAAAGLARRGWW